MARRVLVTGATGYIGSNVCAALHNAGHDVVGLDNFSNSHPAMTDVLAEVAAVDQVAAVDIRDRTGVAEVLQRHNVDAVIHAAGLKSVAESVADPLRYYDTNVGGTRSLLLAMQDAGVGDLVFSSSCTVYGNGPGGADPVDECSPIRPVNPYGRTKAQAEAMIRDLSIADPTFRSVSLRYFNPAGAGAGQRLGDQPLTQSTNLIPAAISVAGGEREALSVHGSDYPTPDGTCIRDYLHVADLAAAHSAALTRLEDAPPYEAINLGRNEGSSVLEVVRAVEEATARQVKMQIGDRRPGDAVALYASSSKATELLGWKAERGLSEICSDQWSWWQAHRRAA